MNDEKRESMIGSATAVEQDYWRDWGDGSGNVDDLRFRIADFALEQMRPLEDRIAELERQLAVAVEALSDMPNQVPTTWLDPLLTGPYRVVNGDSTSRDTEALLRAVKARIRDKSDEALTQIRGGAAAGKPDEAEVRG